MSIIKNKINKNLYTNIYALGGLDEVGKNCYCFQTLNEIIIVDAGQKFTDRSNFSADAEIPNYKYLKNNENLITGLFITHGHEDHIGAIPFLIQHLKLKKIFVTRISRQLILNKLNYAKIDFNPNIFQLLEVGKKVRTKNFIITPFNVNHSIPEALGFHIQAPGGSIIITGDFKFDQMQPNQNPSYELLSKWGNKGVDLLMSDSTNAKVDGFSKSENEIGRQLEKIIANSKNRIIISTFASNMYRVKQIISSAVKHNRKVCIIGKSMEKAVEILINEGYLKKGNWRIETKELEFYEKNEVIIICTGSQGESLAALKRIADNRVKYVNIEKGDQIIFSSSPIPGNKVHINFLTNQFVKQGGCVFDSSEFESIHASGHGYKIEQQLMLNLVKPKYFFPIHGNTSMLEKHKENAIKTGIDSNKIFICSNGDIIQLKDNIAKKTTKTIPAKPYFVDSKTNVILEDDIKHEGDKMEKNGVALIYCLINKKERKIKDLIIKFFGCNNTKNVIEKKSLIKYIENQITRNPDLDELNNLISKHVGLWLKNKKAISPLISVISAFVNPKK